MHIVIVAWLFVTGVMALAMSRPLAAAAWFLGVGVLPVAALVWLAARRSRSRLEREVERRDDRHA